MSENNEENETIESEVEESSPLCALERVSSDETAVDKPRHNVLWVIAFLLCIIALIAGARLTYTAFTANDFMKAVAVTHPSPSLFASDMLSPYTNKDENVTDRPVIVGADEGKCSFSFKIYNCMLDAPEVFNDKEIRYTLSIEAVDTNGQPVSADKWTMNPSAGVIDFSGTKSEIKSYTVSFNRELVDNVTFKVRATVDQSVSKGTSLYWLAANINPAQRAKVDPASVQSSWPDGASSVKSFDAYNYRITVTGKEATVQIRWGEKVELDPFFAMNHTDAKVNSEERTATFKMSPGSGIVNFYRVGSDEPDSWDDIGVSVTEVN